MIMPIYCFTLRNKKYFFTLKDRKYFFRLKDRKYFFTLRNRKYFFRLRNNYFVIYILQVIQYVVFHHNLHLLLFVI